MKHDFYSGINRENTLSVKWDTLKSKFGTDDVIPMWVADMDFACAKPIVDAINNRAQHPVFGYVDSGNILFEAISSWTKKRNNWDISNWKFHFTPGVVPAVLTAIQEFSNVGDYILIQKPVYYPFSDSIISNERKVLNSPLVYNGKEFELDIKAFEKTVIEHKPKVFVLCSPHNPVGKVFTKAELEAMGNICAENDVLIVSDEIHCDIIFDNKKFIHMAEISEKISNSCITLMAPSKTFNVAGMKASVVVTQNNELSKRIASRIAKNGLGGVSVFAVPVFVAAYTECEYYVEQMIEYIQSNRDYLAQYLLENMPKIKLLKLEATYIPLIDCKELNMSNEELEEFFIKKAKVAPDFGTWFGEEGKGFIRLNIGCSQKILKQALEQMLKAYNDL